MPAIVGIICAGSARARKIAENLSK